MKILFEKKQKQVLENADYIFEAIDTRNEEMMLEAVMKAVEITHIVGGEKALRKSKAWKKYMASFEKRLKEHLDHQILYGEGKHESHHTNQ